MSNTTFILKCKRECAELILDYDYMFRQARKATSTVPTAVRR